MDETILPVPQEHLTEHHPAFGHHDPLADVPEEHPDDQVRHVIKPISEPDDDHENEAGHHQVR